MCSSRGKKIGSRVGKNRASRARSSTARLRIRGTTVSNRDQISSPLRSHNIVRTSRRLRGITPDNG